MYILLYFLLFFVVLMKQAIWLILLQGASTTCVYHLLQDMQEQRSAGSSSLIDPLTDVLYALTDGELEISGSGRPVSTFPLPNIGTDVRRKNNRFYLKFSKKPQAQVTVSPQGTLVTSKSDRIQEVDFNITLAQGQIWWELFVPHTTLFLTVGVKDTKNTVFHTFDFCLKNSAKLQFKLNIDNLTFRTWLNGLPSEAKPTIVLDKGLEWIPFIRIREIGTTLSLNPIISDPQHIGSEFNPFHTNSEYELGKEEFKIEDRAVTFEKQSKFKHIALAGRDNLLISGQNEIKLIKRNKSSNLFEFGQLLQKVVEGENEKYLLTISQEEVDLLSKAESIWGVRLLGAVIRHNERLWISKSQAEWQAWMNAVCLELDRKLATTETKQLTLLIYRWILHKIEALRSILTVNLKITTWNSFDSDLISSIYRNAFHPHSPRQSLIEPFTFVNSLPYFSFSQSILSINSTENYVFLKFPSNKLTIFSTRGTLFKVGDFIISKAIKKENELAEYRKEGEGLKENDFTKPNIYKILKNCLKYADKVKPPEKLIKELEQKKNLIKEKEKAEKKPENEIVPDKQLQNTLIQMGFSINLARTALIQCKNSSLEAALDIIVTLPQTEPVKTIAPKKEWTCQTCTLVNAENVPICSACESPAPLFEQIEEKKEEVAPAPPPPPPVDQQIKSDKIEEQLLETYSFETNIGFVPLIVGGVFNSQIRFRMFCLNPRFYTTFYEKSDAFVNLIDNTLGAYNHEITSNQIESLAFSYYDQTELKEKCFAWVPIEDYDQPLAESVSEIRFEAVGFTKDQFSFKAYLSYPAKVRCLTFKINTSNVYLEKRKSFLMVKDEWLEEKLPPSQTLKQLCSNNEEYENCKEINIKANSSLQFTAYFSYALPSPVAVKQIESVRAQINCKMKPLSLSVLKSPQQNIYPHVLFISPWTQSYTREGVLKNSLVLGHLQGLKTNVEFISLQIANKQEKLSGFVYFSNDYNLKPLETHSFRFEGNENKLNLKFEGISALYIAVVLEPHKDNQLIELSEINVFGSVTQASSVESLEISYSIPADQVKLSVVGTQEGSEIQIRDFKVETSIINPSYDLTFYDNDGLKKNEGSIYQDLKLKVRVDSEIAKSFSKITLKSAEITNWRQLSIDSSIHHQSQVQSAEQLRKQFNTLLDEYLITSEKSLLQSLISQKYANFKQQIKEKSLKQFILNHVASAPFDGNKKFYFQIFINSFESELKAHKQLLDLQNIILLGLKSESITAFGLELLLHLNKTTNSLSNSQLMNATIHSLHQIQQWRSNHQSPYTPYEQKSIFSPYIHQLLAQNKQQSDIKSIDRIHQNIVLKKYKLSRRYIIDFCSVHHLRAIDLIFEQSNTKNKMIVSIKWVNPQGNQIGNANHFVDYGEWTQLAGRANGGVLAIDLARHGIQTRYLIVDCNFTLKSLNGAKIQAQNLVEKDIIPIAYGNYVREQQSIPSFTFDGLKDAKFITKTLNFNKYALSGAADSFYFEEDELKPEAGDLAALKNKLELKENRQKWIKLQMNNPRSSNIDFHFTLLCQISQIIAKSKIKEDEALPSEWIELIINHAVQNQYLPIQEVILRAIRHILEHRIDLHNLIMNCQFRQSHLISTLFKTNPLLRAQERTQILKQLSENSPNNKVLANNSLNLIKNLKNSEQIQSVRELGVGLLKLFNSEKKQDEICDICLFFGWIDGIDEVFQNSRQTSTKKALAKASKTPLHLAKYLKQDLSTSLIGENFWIILEQIIAKGFNTHEFNEIFNKFLSQVSELRENEYSEGQTFILFERFIKIMKNVSFDESISRQIIQIYFTLSNRNALLSEFLKSSFLSSPFVRQILAQVSLKQLSSLTYAKSSKYVNNQDQFNFLIDIFAFIYQDEKPQFVDSKKVKAELYHIVADFLQKFINLGGAQGCRYLKECQISKITLSYYLTIQLSKEDSVKSQDLEKIVYWYILNNSEAAIGETNAMKKLKSIHENVWKNLLSGFNEPDRYASVIGKVIINILDETRAIKQNRFLTVIYQSKVYAFLKQLFKHFEETHQRSAFLALLLRKSAIFNKILQEIQSITTFETNENQILIEKELANSLKLLHQEKPKDWVAYKQGAKQNIFTVEFKNETKQFKSLTFESNNLYWLSQLVIGFELNSQVLAPKEISLELGQSEENMKLVGTLELIPLESYLVHSVKLFAINFHRLRSKKWNALRTSPCRFARIIIKSPYVNPLFENIDKTSSTFQEVSKVSFLSVSGYEQNGASTGPNDVHDLVDSLQILSSSKNKELLGCLLNEDENVKHFQKSLLNLSYLMGNERYGLQLHKFLMRVCELNISVGNTMLKEYLQLKNPYLFSKIAAEIAGSNLVESARRASSYFEFIRAELQTSKQSQLLPFVNKFTQLVSTLHKMHTISSLVSEVSIEIPEKLVKLILKRAETDISYKKFARLILSNQKPLMFVGFNSEGIYEELYHSNSSSNLELLSSLITGQPRCAAWFVEKKYISHIFNTMVHQITENKETERITNMLSFLTILCQNAQIKDVITKSQYDLKIFEILVSKEGEKLLSETSNKQLRQKLVEFIARASLGTENERIIGALLKDSLGSMVLESSQQFVAEIFLPLLNSYSKTTLSLLPFNKSESKLLTDLSILKIQGDQAPKIDERADQTYKLSSRIIAQSQNTTFFLKLKQISHHKWGAFNLLTNHGKSPSFKNIDQIKRQILKGQKSVLILLGSKVRIGAFFNHSKETILSKNSIGWTRGSFAFEIDEKGAISVFSYVFPKESLLIYESSEKSTEPEQINSLKLKYKNKVVAEIFFDGITQSIVSPGSLKGKQQQSHILQSAEYWTFDSESISSYETVFANQETFAKKLLSQLNDYTFFRSELKASQSLELLRQEPLYEFPSSITLNEVKKSIEIYGYVFSDDNLDKIKLRNLKGQQIKQNSTLDALCKKSATNDLILEVLIQTDTLPPIQPKVNSSKVEYLPRKGILKFFEQNDGVKAMIKVIKKSIGEWKNPSRKEKWEQYAVELQNFSAFPHFFSAYLKDKDTFKLLLDLLSGLPDKETDAKWDELEVASSQKLLKIVSDILSMDHTNEFRIYALKHDFMTTILERLRILSGIFKRRFESEVVEEVDNSPSKKQIGEDDGTKKIKKKKGVGYGNDTNSNTKWMKGQNLANLKKDFENIETILMLVESFLTSKEWNIPQMFLDQLLESSLLPYIEDCLRAGTLLEISKHPEKFKAVLKLIRALAKQEKLLVCLLPLSQNYQPSQTESIQSLLKSLFNISKIFISCLNQNLTQEDKISKEFANDIIDTYNLVEEAIEERQNVGNDENEITTILALPLDKKYRELLKDLRFDYIDMKESPNKIKHHYSSNFTANYTPNHNKMIRLAQELADISTALPHEHTNAVFVRCDKDRVDFMQALIMGSNGTPYGHGAFLFDIYFDDNYPNGPPKVNLTTTGHGKIRFNPNLYSCGKVCLSLLGTWRGSASENWDAKVSTLLQVLLSIQAIIMSEEVYFNEPGFQNEQGTEEGEKKNEAYSNIVRYGNVKFAMLENIKNPPKGFEAIIRRHFYLKKDEIMEQCKRWLKYAQKRPANYVGLVNDHNVSWSAEFKKSKTQYKQMLEKAIKELEEELNKLTPPKPTDITPKHIGKKERKRKDESKNALTALQGAKLQEIDVSYEKLEGKELDINDQKVRDRWSRYIGAMGIDAVSRQSKADILIFGLGPFGLEVIKNIALSGCRKLTLCDDESISLEDLSGGFFYQQQDIGKKRIDTIIHRIRELNSYVKIDTIARQKLSLEVVASYSLIFASEIPLPEQRALAVMCRESKVKFISADCRGAYCRLVNDFGEFTVLDKNGEEPTEVMLGNIDISEQGLVTLLEGAKHPFEDGEAVVINHVEGMSHLENKQKSINGTIHTIKVVNFKSFEIGNTLHYEKYIRNGTAKNIKTPVVMKFRPFEASIDPEEKQLGFDQNLEFFDFSKLANERLVQRCFITLDHYRIKNKTFPKPWDAKDAQIFTEIYSSLWKEELAAKEKIFLQEFSFTCRGYLPPLCAFFGGLAAQQIIKAITQKYKPINSSVYLEFSEIIPKKETEEAWVQKDLDIIYASDICIEGTLVDLQETQQIIKAHSARPTTKQLIEQVKQPLQSFSKAHSRLLQLQS